MPATDLVTFGRYCRQMAGTVEDTIGMAHEDLYAARQAAAGTTADPAPLSVPQALEVVDNLSREHRLWCQLAGEIDDYLRITHAMHAGVTHGTPEPLLDLFTPQPEELRP